MTQDTVNETQAIRELLHREEKRQKEILDAHVNRIMELRHLIDRMVEEVPSLKRKFKEEIDRLND
jgi:hypothetical protein